MKIATLYYVALTDDHVEEINRFGWESPVGKTYNEIKMKPFKAASMLDAASKGMIVKVAEYRIDPHGRGIDDPVTDILEEIFLLHQNGISHGGNIFITGGGTVSDEDRAKRSMMVGDFIVFDDGRAFRCENAGWKEV